MTGKKKTGKEISIVRSSAAEYLTFVAASGSGGVEAVYADESIWLTQKMMGVLYDVETHTINYHLKKVFGDSELEENAVIRNSRITAFSSNSLPLASVCAAITTSKLLFAVIKYFLTTGNPLRQSKFHMTFFGNYRDFLDS